MKVNGNHVASLLEKGNRFLIQNGKSFEVENYSEESRKIQDFGKEGFVLDMCSNMDGIDLKSTRKELLNVLLDNLDTEAMQKLYQVLQHSYESNCYPTGNWFDMDVRIKASSSVKDKVSCMLLLDELPDFLTIDQMVKEKKGDKEFKELFAPLITLAKVFPKTGDESLPALIKAIALKSEHEKIKKLAVVFSDYMRKGFYHCFRSFDLKEFLKILENEDIIFEKVSGQKKREALKFLSVYLSIMEKFLEEDKKTGFWKLQQDFEEKVTYFDVQIEDGNLLSSPKIVRAAAMDVDQDVEIEQTSEQKGEYKEKVNAAPNDVKESKVDTKTNIEGSFSEGFNPSKTKHEESIEIKHRNELVELLRKNGVPLEKDSLMDIDLKDLFQSVTKKRSSANEEHDHPKKQKQEPGEEKKEDTSTATEEPPKSAKSTTDSSNKSSSNPKTQSNESSSTKTSAKPKTSNADETQSKSSNASSSDSSPSTPVKTKKGKFFKKLKTSPKASSGNKYCKVDASAPIQNEHNKKFEVIFGITFINELNRGEDKIMFEFRAPIFIKSLRTGYSTWEEDDYRFILGSMNKVTEKILCADMSSVRIRANPGSLNNDYLSFNTYAKYQAMLRITLDATSLTEAKKEVPKLIEELQNILASPDWFLCYQISTYWEFVSSENTTEVDGVLDELWTKAAKDEENPSFDFIKNGLPKVFKDSVARARGGLYSSLIIDAKNSLSADIGNNPIVSTLNLKLDEFLCYEDIGIAATHFFREFSEGAALKLFKEKFDDPALKQKEEKAVKLSITKRRQRQLESNYRHHEIVDKDCNYRADQVLSFREDLIPRTNTFFFKRIYDLYLSFAAYGQKKYFMDFATDPLIETNKKQSYKKMYAMETDLKELEQERDPVVSISDETRRLFYVSSRSRQREIIQMIIFEARNQSICNKKCSVCRGIFVYNKLDEEKAVKCKNCEKNKRTRNYFSPMYPVWYDKKRKKSQYSLPPELQDLTLTEKMLIQTQSFLIPCIHIGKGKFGLCGHTVMFKRDIASICKVLPRIELDYIEIRKLSVHKDQQSYDTFKVRRKKVLHALHWLKENNKFYADITIDEKNLDWMNKKEEDIFCNFKENITLSETYNNCSVSAKQTRNPIGEESIEMCGTASDRADSLFSENSKELIQDFSNMQPTSMVENRILWPETDEMPVDEFTEEECFAKCYPWLFPGGVGDISHKIKSDRTKAIEWTRLLLTWEDGRFQHDPCFTFHAFNFIQRHVNNGSSISLLHTMFSEHKSVDTIKQEIENGNFSSVSKIQNFAAQKIRGSDGWWRSRKHELDSWVAHHLDKGHGPPTLFMTFSCAEYWWKDLLLFLMERIKKTEDRHHINTLKNGSEEEKRKIQAKLVDKYTASVQIFFQERLDNWMETIGREVFNIKHYYLRFEFAKGRGQIHAHMVAITTDLELLSEFYRTYCVQGKEQLGANLMEEYVQNVLSLTEEIDLETTEMESSHQELSKESTNKRKGTPLASTFSESICHKVDICQLCHEVHMHDCSDYCLGHTTNKPKARNCRMGAGTESVPNDPTSTPGFDSPKEFATIEKDYKKDIHILKLKRNHSRLKKTSTSMLESWRANCDVSVIIYATDPNNIVPADIARISGYITSYCTKGNMSYQEERSSIASIISNYDYCAVKSAKMNMSAMLQKTMNSLLTSRVISKPEASVELMDMDLYWCTESAKHINLTGLQKLLKTKKKPSDPIQKYKHRHTTQEHHTFVEYMKVLDKTDVAKTTTDKRIRKRQSTDKMRYLHPVGFNSSPVFPVTSHYAIATLVLHKKWDNNNRLDFELKRKTPEEEFHEFLRSKDCPQCVKLQYCIAKHKFERKLFGTGEKEHHNKDLSELNEDQQDLYNLVCNGRYGRSDYGDEFYRGQDGYDFNKTHYDFDCDNKSGPTWLEQTIKEVEEVESNAKKIYINKDTNKPYILEDIGDNEEQNEIAYQVLQKIKEWMEFPEIHKHDSSKKFEPLVLTVRGAGGTGKSFLVKVILNAIESMFGVRVSQTCAPTGCAAYNIFGKTIHSLFCINIDDPTKELSEKQKQRLFELLRNVLVLVIDERSMLSLEILNAISRNCSEFAHGTGNTEQKFGGIPVVLILGDDSQLPPVKSLGAFDTFTQNGYKNDKLTGSDLKGAGVLQYTVNKVKSLKQVKRIVEDEKMLQQINNTLRTESGLSKEQSLALCKLNLDNKDISDERRNTIQQKALYVYTTKEEVFEHNERELKKVVSKQNPLMEFSFQIESTERSKSNKPTKNHFKVQTLVDAKTVLTRGARVSLTKNKWAIKGLYNGSLGTVIDIRFDKGCSPLLGDLPLVVIVDFDNYTGPPWDKNNPTFVPIPMSIQTEDKAKCNYKCCQMKFVPLEIAFARTLHKVQGQSIGNGHPIPIMVFNPGKTSFEGNNPGLLYTGISRATSMGNNDVNTSAIYFNYNSKYELYDRIRDIHHKRKPKSSKNQTIISNDSLSDFVEPSLTKEKYVNVKKRKYWTDFLDKQEEFTDLTTSASQRRDIEQWLHNQQIKKTNEHELYSIVQFHSKRYKTK